MVRSRASACHVTTVSVTKLNKYTRKLRYWVTNTPKSRRFDGPRDQYLPELGRKLVLEAEHGQQPRLRLRARFAIYLTENVYKVVLQKSVPAQIRQLIMYICSYKG